MGEKMKRPIWLFTIPLVLLSASAASATSPGSGTKLGEWDDEDVIIEHVGGTQISAHGAIGTARSESSSGGPEDKWIGCWVDASATGSMVTCWALSSFTGETARCAAIDPPLVAAVSSMNSDAKITFDFDAGATSTTSNLNGSCRHIRVENFSYYNVKSP